MSSDLLPDALSEALSRVIADKSREWQIRLDAIAAEARATIADLNRVVAEKGAEILALKVDLKERVDGEIARVSTAVSAALAAVKNGDDADPEVVAEIAAKRASDDLSVMIRGEVEAIGTDIKAMSDGFDARIDARITAQAPDVPALVASAVDQAIVSRGILGAPDVHKMLSGEIEKLSPQPTEAQIRAIAVEEATRAVEAAIPELPQLPELPELPDVVGLVDNAVAAAFVTVPVPRDGKSVDPEDVRRMVADEVRELPPAMMVQDVVNIAAAEAERTVAALPVPAIITADEMAGFVTGEISKAVEALPAPVATDEIRTIAAAEAEKAVVAVLVPEVITAAQMAGFVRGEISRAVEALPAPVATDEIRTIAVAEAEKIVAALPVPAIITADEMAGFVTGEISKAFETLPAPMATDEMRTIAAAEAEKAVAALPVPAIITADEMAGFVRGEIGKAVEALPVPVATDEIRTIAAAEAEKAVAALPVPEIITADQMAGFVTGEISKAFETLPVPISVDDVRAAAFDVTVRAIAEIPAPQAQSISDLSEVVGSAIETAIGSLVPPCTAEQIRAIAEEEAAKALAALPEPVSLSVDDLVPAIDKAAQQAVKSLPLPKEPDEVDYDRVQKFIEDRISAIPPAANGIGYRTALIDRDGALVLTRDDGAIVTVGVVAGKDADQAMIASLVRDEVAKFPKPRDGLDGVGFDDLSCDFDGERTLTLRWERGEKVKEYKYRLNIPLDRGVYQDGRQYEKSDFVTFGGRSWIAQCDTAAKPDAASKDWRLMANKGRDGKDFDPARQLGPSEPVKLR